MKRRPCNPRLISRARALRKNQTSAEAILWSRLRRKQVFDIQFYRQRPIGNYIVDFYCPSKKVIIEVDGGQHSYNDEQARRDRERDKFLTNVLKYKILRFTNLDVLKSLDDVLDVIAREVAS